MPEVLQLVAEGRVRKEIAQILGASVKTVEFHKQKLTENLDLHTDAALTAYAIRHGIASTSKLFVIDYPATSRCS